MNKLIGILLIVAALAFGAAALHHDKSTELERLNADYVRLEKAYIEDYGASQARRNKFEDSSAKQRSMIASREQVRDRCMFAGGACFLVALIILSLPGRPATS